MTEQDNEIPCPFLGCVDPADAWYDRLWTPDFAGMPARFRICAKHKMIMEGWMDSLLGPTSEPRP